MSFFTLSEIPNDLNVKTSFMPMFFPVHWFIGIEQFIERDAEEDLLDFHQIDSDESRFSVSCDIEYSQTKNDIVSNITVLLQFQTRRDLDVFKLKHSDFCMEYIDKN